MIRVVVLVLCAALVAFFIQRFVVNKKAARVNKQSGSAFLEENKTREGVQTSASGLQYLLLEAGEGQQHPQATDRVKVHYHGTLTDGSVFDSSVARGEPIEFSLKQVIPGWTEGLQLMVEGEKARLFIPSNLAYGDRAVGSIPAGATLIFDVELIEIKH